MDPLEQHRSPLMDHPGPFCESINLSTKDLETNHLNALPDGNLKQGVVVELHKYAMKNKQTNAKIVEWICSLQPGLKLQNVNTVKTRINRIIETQKKFDKKKKVAKYKTVTEFHCDSLTVTAVNGVKKSPEKSPLTQTVEIVNVEKTEVKSHANCAKVGSAKPEKLIRKSRTDDEKENNDIQYQITLHQRKLDKLYEMTDMLKEDVTKLQNIKGHYSVRNVTKRDGIAMKKRQELRETKQLLHKYKQTSKKFQMEKSDTSAELIDLKSLNEKLLAENRKLKDDQKKKVNAQKLNSYYRSTIRKIRGCQPPKENQKNEVQNEDDDVEMLLENEIIKDNTNATMTNLKDDRGIFSNELRMCIIYLFGLEVAVEKITPAIQIVAKHLFHCNIEASDMPTNSSVQNIVDEGQFLVKSYIADRIKKSESFGLSRDGTSRQKRKILDTAITLDNGEIVSLGFKRVVSETAAKINDVTKSHFKELAKVDSDSHLRDIEESNFVAESLQKLAFTMSDRAANEKCADKLLSEWRDNELELCSNEGSKATVLQFHCIAHVLLGFHRYACEDLKHEEKSLAADEPIGRDQLPFFKNWSKKQPVVERVAYTTSTIFGPAGDHLGLRDRWESHCAAKGIKSLIGNYRDNRFNGLFQTSAEILYHLSDFLLVFKTVKCPNNKIKAVEADLVSPVVQTMLKALTAAYTKVTGPYWWLVCSGTVRYLELYPYIDGLRSYLSDCEETPANMLEKHWLDHSCVPHTKKFSTLLNSPTNELLLKLISVLCGAMRRTVEKQLVDFLDGGRYAGTPSKSDLQRTHFSHVTNLGCEHHFGDLDSSQRRRPNASFHHHSSVQLIKRNRRQLFKWLDEKPDNEKATLMKAARSGGRDLRKAHMAEESLVKRELFNTMQRGTKEEEEEVQ
ncbi:uncharacterized protein LOC128237051 [Mya arenaria]|uniref:uncharacterized protein LOC128237051 n=1 Tax=Mya arenaria TaxID=6604 RepID=UPI0022E97CE4|nr:uncharacterized protein LOC128237051 [Mya arenaria]XP_052808199.1 uncharacterized protein LOC128237051 [Mya arenaria]